MVKTFFQRKCEPVKKWLIEWETDYCDNFPERRGASVIEAETEEEAAQIFNKNALSKQNIIDISELGGKTK